METGNTMVGQIIPRVALTGLQETADNFSHQA